MSHFGTYLSMTVHIEIKKLGLVLYLANVRQGIFVSGAK